MNKIKSNTKKSTTTRKIVVNGVRKSGTKRSPVQKTLDWATTNLRILIFIFVFGGIGTYFLIRSFAATPTAPSSTFNITTWNSAFDNPNNIGSSILDFGRNSDILGLQEVHTPAQRKNIKSKLLCSTCKYDAYVKDYTYNGSSPASLPILWNKAKFSLVSKGYYTMSSKVTGINDLTGKNMSISAKYITWVQLRDKTTTRSFYVLNLHTVAGVEWTSYYHPETPVPSGYPMTPNAKRIATYKKGMDVLVSKLTSLAKNDRPIIVIGDFNVDYRYDSIVKDAMFPYARLTPLKVMSSYEKLKQIAADPTLSTHGTEGRLIDYVFTMQNSRLAVNNEFIDTGTYGSDHHPVTNTLTIYNADPATLPAPAAIPIGASAQEATSTVTTDIVTTETR